MWEIGFDGVGNLRIRHGYTDGVIREDLTPIEVNTSGRTLQQQALLEARHRYTAKYRAGYLPAGAIEPPKISAMKGEEYKPEYILSWPVNWEFKLNGIRMLVQDKGVEGLVARSWRNTSYAHLTHIVEDLTRFYSYLPPYSTLDGELYNHHLDFTMIQSIVRTSKTIHPNVKEITYYIFDIYYQQGEQPVEQRRDLLHSAFTRYCEDGGEAKYWCLLPAYIAHCHEDVLEAQCRAEREGYEGLFVKKRANGATSGPIYEQSLYLPRKCRNILKLKSYQDEEALVVGVVEAKGTEQGAAILEVLDKRGNRFTVRMKGTVERRREWYRSPDTIVGKEVTIRYNGLSIYGVPQFPRGVAVRDYE
jgi:ATP-dependent DNA ligase